MFSCLTPAACLVWHQPSTKATASAQSCCPSADSNPACIFATPPPVTNNNCMMASVPMAWDRAHCPTTGPAAQASTPLPSTHLPAVQPLGGHHQVERSPLPAAGLTQPPEQHPATCPTAAAPCHATLLCLQALQGGSLGTAAESGGTPRHCSHQLVVAASVLLTGSLSSSQVPSQEPADAVDVWLVESSVATMAMDSLREASSTHVPAFLREGALISRRKNRAIRALTSQEKVIFHRM